MVEEYKLKLAKFEGPLDLLLDLIEKRKLFVNDISLAEVTDNYISYLGQLEEYSLGLSANFLVIASTLLLIKSRSLLPGLQITEEEQEDIDSLKERLILYQDIHRKSQFIQQTFGKNIIFEGGLKNNLKPVFSPAKDATKDSLLSAIKNVLNNIPKMKDIPQAVIKKIITLEEAINNLASRVGKNLKMSFNQFTKIKGRTKEEVASVKSSVIVSFLAVLELVKRGIILVNQQRHFDDISMETATYDVPKY